MAPALTSWYTGRPDLERSLRLVSLSPEQFCDVFRVDGDDVGLVRLPGSGEAREDDIALLLLYGMPSNGDPISPWRTDGAGSRGTNSPRTASTTAKR
jgi:hypothetical protein